MPRTVLATTVAGAVVTYDSGYGSALAMKPGTTDEFYLMTDRGPNIDGASGSKVFVDPTFNPNIGHFRMLADGSLERLKVFGKRRANRGMEGLTTTPDGSTLVGIMQSPLYNPTSVAISGSRICRILC